MNLSSEGVGGFTMGIDQSWEEEASIKTQQEEVQFFLLLVVVLIIEKNMLRVIPVIVRTNSKI